MTRTPFAVQRLAILLIVVVVSLALTTMVFTGTTTGSPDDPLYRPFRMTYERMNSGETETIDLVWRGPAAWITTVKAASRYPEDVGRTVTYDGEGLLVRDSLGSYAVSLADSTPGLMPEWWLADRSFLDGDTWEMIGQDEHGYDQFRLTSMVDGVETITILKHDSTTPIPRGFHKMRGGDLVASAEVTSFEFLNAAAID